MHSPPRYRISLQTSEYIKLLQRKLKVRNLMHKAIEFVSCPSLFRHQKNKSLALFYPSKQCKNSLFTLFYARIQLPIYPQVIIFFTRNTNAFLGNQYAINPSCQCPKATFVGNRLPNTVSQIKIVVI